MLRKSFPSRVAIALAIVIAFAGARAEITDSVFVAANNPIPVASHITLMAGVWYRIDVTGIISYWGAVDSTNPDADAAAVWHVPNVSGVPAPTVTAANAFVGYGRALPLDGDTAITNPGPCSSWAPMVRSRIWATDSLRLDKTYFSVNGAAFCMHGGPSGGGPLHVYTQMILGDGNPASFVCRDGDGDYTNNSGTLVVVIRQLEPRMSIGSTSIYFGTHPFGVSLSQSDPVTNLGELPLPGCAPVATVSINTMGISNGGPGEFGFYPTGTNPLAPGDTMMMSASFYIGCVSDGPYSAKFQMTASYGADTTSTYVDLSAEVGFTSAVGGAERSDNGPRDATIDIFPNPASGVIRVRIAVPRGESEGELRIVDELGRIVAARVVRNGAADIELGCASLPAGIYRASITGRSGATMSRLFSIER